MPLHSSVIKYFHVVASTGSIRRASEQLHISPSAIYRKIQNLEEELGVPLFIRSAKGVEVTSAGRMLAEHIERTLLDAEYTLRRIATQATGQSSIVVAGSDGCVAEIISAIFTNFQSTRSQVSTTFSRCSTIESISLLQRGSADVAIVFNPEIHSDLVYHCSEAMPVGAVLPPDHVLCSQKELTLEMVSKFPLVLPDYTWTLRPELDHCLSKLKTVPDIVNSSSSVDLMKHMVSNHLGIGLQTVVGLISAIESRALVFKELSGSDAMMQTLSVCTQKSKPLTRNVQMLIDALLSRIERYRRFYDEI